MGVSPCLGAKIIKKSIYLHFTLLQLGKEEKRPFPLSGLFHTLTIPCQPTQAEQLPASPLS
jgi:hypothetical protein